MFSIALISVLAVAVSAAPQRAVYEKYLRSVYNQSDFSSLSDATLFDLYDNLTFYYENHPPSPFGRRRRESHLYAGTTCDCLHIQLPDCVNKARPYNMCEYWNETTYCNMEWLEKEAKPIPSNAWFEGLTYVGEWGWPVSCWNNRWRNKVYGFWGHMWLYPMKGIGLWFNVGKTAWSYTKVGWLIKYGQNIYGSNKTEIMDWAAEKTCPGYKSRSSSCEVCSNPLDTSKCCCHGSGRNLGCQVRDYKNRHRLSWNDALDQVADFYINGAFGEEGNSKWRYPSGTYFGIVNILDDYIMSIQRKFGYATAQFVREPQHSQVYKEFSDPVYSFEILWNVPRIRGWKNFCALDGQAFGVLDPLKEGGGVINYLSSNFIQQPKKVQKTTAWKPRPEFLRYFGMHSSDLFEYDTAQPMSAPANGPLLNTIQDIKGMSMAHKNHGRW